MKKRFILFMAASLAFSFFARPNDFAEFFGEQKVQKCVCSTKGLSVWSEPSFDSQKIGGLYNLEAVNVVARGQAIETVNEIENCWMFIEYGGAFGWVLGHFLAASREEAEETLALAGDWYGDRTHSLLVEYLGFARNESDGECSARYRYDWNSGGHRQRGVGNPIGLSAGGDRGFSSGTFYLDYENGMFCESIRIQKWEPLDGEDFESGAVESYDYQNTIYYSNLSAFKK